MKPIYEPSGRAREYSPLALNLFTGCDRGCTYCYNKKTPWVKEDFEKPKLRKGVLDALKKQATTMKGDKREILMSFTCDPYPANTDLHTHTREALDILIYNGLTATILTKGGTDAVKDFDLLKMAGFKFGTTLTVNRETDADAWELFAASVSDRMTAIKTAHDLGIKTWVSLEPVIFASQALEIIADMRDYVDFWKIGKLNYYPAISDKVNWKEFLHDVSLLLPKEKYMIKIDTLKAAGYGDGE